MLARLEGAPGQSLEASEKAIVSERSANALRGAQAGEQIWLPLAGKQIGEAGEAVADGFQRGDAVVLVAQMRPRARPPPILRPLRQPCCPVPPSTSDEELARIRIRSRTSSRSKSQMRCALSSKANGRSSSPGSSPQSQLRKSGRDASGSHSASASAQVFRHDRPSAAPCNGEEASNAAERDAQCHVQSGRVPPLLDLRNPNAVMLRAGFQDPAAGGCWTAPVRPPQSAAVA